MEKDSPEFSYSARMSWNLENLLYLDLCAIWYVWESGQNPEEFGHVVKSISMELAPASS